MRSRVYPSSIKVKAIRQRLKETFGAVVRLINGAATEQERQTQKGDGQQCPTGCLDTEQANGVPMHRAPTQAPLGGVNDRFFPFRNATACPLLKAGMYGSRDEADSHSPATTRSHTDGLDKLSTPIFDQDVPDEVGCSNRKGEGSSNDGTKRCKSMPRDLGSQRTARLLNSHVVSEGNLKDNGIAGAKVASFAQYVGFQFRGSMSGYESGNSAGETPSKSTDSCSPEETIAATASLCGSFPSVGTAAAGHGRGSERINVPAEPRKRQARSRPGRNREEKPLVNLESVRVSCPMTQKQVTREGCPGRRCP